MRGWPIFAAVAATASCGDDALEPDPGPVTAAWDTVCGTEGPHRVLPLADGEYAYRVERGGSGDGLLISTYFVDPLRPPGSAPTLAEAIYGVGECGEQPVAVATGLITAGRYGTVSLACGAQQHGVWSIDPQGQQPPRLLLDGGCPARSTDEGLLTVRSPPGARYGALALLRDPDDADATAQVLATDVRTARNAYFGVGGSGSTSLWAAGSRAFVLDAAGTVWRVDLSPTAPDPIMTEVLTGVRELRVSGDARWLLWQALEPAEGEADTPVGPVFLRDLSAQTDVYLLNTHLEWTGSPYVGPYLLVRDDASGRRLWWRDDVEPIELPPGTELRGRLADDALWLTRQVDGWTEEARWHPTEGGEPTVFARHQGSVARYGDGIQIYETDDVDDATEGSLSFVPFAGGEPMVLAKRVHRDHGRLADGRILTIVEQDETGHGPLLLIDPEAGETLELDPRGSLQSPRLSASDPLGGDVVFATAGPPMARGVYRARPRP